MNIGILTHHTVINQGAILQMFALKNWLAENGHKVSILTYTKDFDFAPNEAAKYNVSIKYYPYYFKEYVIKKGIGLAWFNVKKQRNARRFISSNFVFKNYALNKMDAVIVGSDEVFSLQNGCNMMMYGHGVNTNHLISYAPSFGQTDIERVKEFHCTELIQSGLNKFAFISVRDDNSAEVVEMLLGEKPRIVCDPVLLYDFSRTLVSIKPIKEKYILVYSYDRWMTEDSEIEAISKYARSKGLITVSAGTYHKWCDKNIVCNPIEWLEYFRGAEEVITDTFHGAIMSIITNRQTAYYVRGLNTNKMTSLLKSFGLDNRILATVRKDEIEKVQTMETDFNYVNTQLFKMREESNYYLKSAIKNCEKR